MHKTDSARERCARHVASVSSFCSNPFRSISFLVLSCVVVLIRLPSLFSPLQLSTVLTFSLRALPCRAAPRRAVPSRAIAVLVTQRNAALASCFLVDSTPYPLLSSSPIALTRTLRFSISCTRFSYALRLRGRRRNVQYESSLAAQRRSGRHARPKCFCFC